MSEKSETSSSYAQSEKSYRRINRYIIQNIVLFIVLSVITFSIYSDVKSGILTTLTVNLSRGVYIGCMTLTFGSVRALHEYTELRKQADDIGNS